MSKSIVRKALEVRVKAFADAQSPVLPVAYENVAFTKPATGLWLECFLIPNKTFNRETTATHSTLIGLFQVNVWSRKGISVLQAEAIAESIVAAFPVIPKIGGVSIEKTPTVGFPLQDDSGWVALPVLMSYRYEA